VNNDASVAPSEQATIPELVARWHEVGGVEDGNRDDRDVLAQSKDEGTGFEALEGTVATPRSFRKEENRTLSVEHIRTGF
jgi:hypothetical protein